MKKNFWSKYENPIFVIACIISAVSLYAAIQIGSYINVAAKAIDEEPEITTTTTPITTTAVSTTVEVTTEATTELVIELIPPAKSEVKYLPDIDLSVKTFTDYRVYNVSGTPHKRLQQACWTDINGFRRFNDDYVVALGSYYTVDIGDRFRVKLETGAEFTVILGDGKDDRDTDSNNQYAPCINYDGEHVGNLLEFIVDADVLPFEVYAYGDVSKFAFMKGTVVELEYIGHDDSNDWYTYY